MPNNIEDNKVALEFETSGVNDVEKAISKVSKLIHNIKQSTGDRRYTRTLEQESQAIKSFYNSQVNKSSKEAIKNAEKLVIQLSKLNNVDFQNVRAENVSIKTKQQLIDAQTRSKAELEFKKENSKELRKQAKEEKKVNDYINGRNNLLEKGISKIQNTVLKVVSLATAWKGVKKAIKLITQANKTYGEYIETLNLAEVSFQHNAEEVVKWSKDYADSLGLSYNEVLKFASSLKSLSDSMGIADEVGSKMSTTLTTLIYNLASLRNLDFEQAYSKIESTIFSGQLRTARTIGVDISVASMQALIEELGYVNVQYEKLTEAQKVQLRTIKVLKDLGQVSAGDLSKTLESTNNRLRILRSSWENLLTVIGSATNTVFSDLIAYAIGAVQALSQFIQELHPLEQSTGLNDTASAMGVMEESIEGINKQLGLLPIDKFETLSSGAETENTISFDTDLNTALSDFDELNKNLENIDEKVVSIRDKFYTFFQSIDKEAFKELFNSIKDFAIDVLPTLINALTKSIKNIIDFITTAYKTNTLIPVLVALSGAIIAVKSALRMNWVGVGIGLAIAGTAGIIGLANYLNPSDDIMTASSQPSPSVNDTARDSSQSLQNNSDNQKKVAQLNINGREFATAVFNDFNYTNKRFTGIGLGGV